MCCLFTWHHNTNRCRQNKDANKSWEILKGSASCSERYCKDRGGCLSSLWIRWVQVSFSYHSWCFLDTFCFFFLQNLPRDLFYATTNSLPGPTVVGYGLEGALKFGFYETFKGLFKTVTPSQFVNFLMASVVAGGVASIVLVCDE